MPQNAHVTIIPVWALGSAAVQLLPVILHFPELLEGTNTILSVNILLSSWFTESLKTVNSNLCNIYNQ